MTRGLIYLGKAIYLVFFAAGFLVAVAFATGFFVATASFFCVVPVLAAGFLIVGAAVAALAETDVDTNASATSDAVRIFFMLCPLVDSLEWNKATMVGTGEDSGKSS